MKKLLSLLLTLCLVLTFTVSAFAGETPKSDGILKELNSTAVYVNGGVASINIDGALSYYYLLSSDKAADFFDGFLQDVKNNLKENGGKIVSSYGENMTTYAAVIAVLDRFGEDVTNVDGVNLVELMKNTPASTITSPYHYDVVIPTAAKHCDEEFIKSICDEFIANNYKTGSGMDYYGFACDNTAMFISAVAGSGIADYADVLKDAVNVLNTYKVEGGYCYNPEYGTEPNADSTGLALRALSAYALYSGVEKADMAAVADVYAELLTFKGTTEGSYTYGGEESAYAASDALKGLSAYYELVCFAEAQTPDDGGDNNNDTNKGDKNDDVKPETNTPSGNKPESKPNNEKVDIPNTDSSSSLCGIGFTALLLSAAVFAIKKNED